MHGIPGWFLWLINYSGEILLGLAILIVFGLIALVRWVRVTRRSED